MGRSTHRGTFRSITTYSRLAIGSFVAAAAASACQRSDEPPLPSREPLPRPTPTASLQTSERPQPTSDPWVKRQVGELRDRTVKWTPRALPLKQVTFAGNRLYTRLASELVSLDPTGRTDTQRFPVQGHPQLVALADGSLLGVGATSTFVIRPGAKQAEGLRSVILFPNEVLYGNAGILGQFDSLDPVVGRWSSYSFESKPGVSSVWLPDTAYELGELKQGLCSQLIDGSYACFAADKLWHLYTKSRATLVGRCTAGAPVWRVLPGPRTDQAWLARNDATLEKWWLVQPLKRLSVIELPWTPIDIAIRGEYIVVVRVVQNRAEPKRLSLVVLDSAGKTRFEQALLPGTEDEANAAEPDIREAEVVLHPQKPWIGLRTSHGTRVLALDTGTTLLQVQ